MISSRKKSFLKVLRNIVIAAVILIVSTFAVTKIVYDSTFQRYDCSKDHTSGYSELCASRRELEFFSGDNKLCGYLYGNGGDILVVLVPGYRACADEYLAQTEYFTDAGMGVFAFDPTGSGKSGGDSAVGFSQAVCDLEDALSFIEENNGFGYRKTVVFGHSRGGYAACCAAGMDFDISAVVTVGGVNSAMEGIIEPVADRVGFLAYSNYPMLFGYQVMLFGDKANMNAADIISDSDIPVLVVHGKNDVQVSLQKYSVISHREEITSPYAEYIICDTAGSDGHVNLLFDGESANKQLMDSIIDFYLRSTQQ